MYWWSVIVAFRVDVGALSYWTSEMGNYKPWNDHGNALRRPIWAYKWGVVAEVTGDPKIMYHTYINEFDALTPEQVIFIFVFLQCLFWGWR